MFLERKGTTSFYEISVCIRNLSLFIRVCSRENVPWPSTYTHTKSFCVIFNTFL
jgi:hypothetical protein